MAIQFWIKIDIKANYRAESKRGYVLPAHVWSIIVRTIRARVDQLSEAEIVEQMFSIFDRYWVLAQWWTSVSFGLILAAFFAAKRLTLFLVLAVVALYCGYTAWVYFLLSYNLDIAFAFLDDLLALENNGVTLSFASKMILESENYRRGELIANIVVPATFIACIGYLVYSYIRTREDA